MAEYALQPKGTRINLEPTTWPDAQRTLFIQLDFTTYKSTEAFTERFIQASRPSMPRI